MPLFTGVSDAHRFEEENLPGPQVVAKKKMWKQIKAIWAKPQLNYLSACCYTDDVNNEFAD
jgi:hypothetical protein